MAWQRRNDPGYGHGVVELSSEDDPHELVLERIRSELSSPDYAPPTLPEVAQQVLRLSQQPDLEPRAILQVISQDPSLVAQLLMAAQSPLYGGRSVQSLQQAAARLGIRGLRDLVLQISLRMKVFRGGPWQSAVREVLRAARVRSVIAGIVAEETGADPGKASLCALLSDMGVAAILMILAPKRGQAAAELHTIWPAVDATHEEAAGRLARAWELDGEVRAVVANHHKLRVGGVPNHLTGSLIVSGAVATRLGLSMEIPGLGFVMDEEPHQVRDARKFMRLDTDAMKRIVRVTKRRLP
ncbi:MAG: HDOD domain-containing protein [Myxococcota bacterium]|nr:HDOD domain-containing protein [Myxococcota bacterium]